MPETETQVIITHTTRAAYNLDKYCSLDYVDTLEEDFSIRAFFHGYSQGGAGDWQNDKWDEKKALDFFIQHMDKIYGKAGCRKRKHMS